MYKHNVLGNFLFFLMISAVMLFSSSAVCEAKETGTRLPDLCHEFNALNTRIRDNAIIIPDAKKQFSQLLADIRKEYYASGGGDYPVSEWVFPLKGYGYRAIGGVNGNGHRKGGYDYFDGNKHTGHPSQDLFIRDKRQISQDDVTHEPVTVLSVSGGVIVAEEKEWASSSPLRGGKYIWIYDPTSNALIYYAHNSTLHVEVGQVVKPGDVIADVGRTGLNAFKRRSPTHLHLTYLSIDNGLPVPRNVFNELMGSQLR